MILIKQNCHYCGAEPRLVNPFGETYHKKYDKKGNLIRTFDRWQACWITMNGIDKKEHREDYTDISNLVPCCLTCNFMKQRLGAEQFLHHVFKIATHRNALPK